MTRINLRQGLLWGGIIGNSHPEEVKSLVSQGHRNRGGRVASAAQEDGPGPAHRQYRSRGRHCWCAHVATLLSATPPLADIIEGALSQNIEALAFAYGQGHGRGLSTLGVNVNFAPLADLSVPRVRSRLDFHSLIARRAIDANSNRVSPAVIGYAHGLETQGVLATFKHFPWYGMACVTRAWMPSMLASTCYWCLTTLTSTTPIMHCLLQAKTDGRLQDKQLFASGYRSQKALAFRE